MEASIYEVLGYTALICQSRIELTCIQLNLESNFMTMLLAFGLLVIYYERGAKQLERM